MGGWGGCSHVGVGAEKKNNSCVGETGSTGTGKTTRKYLAEQPFSGARTKTVLSVCSLQLVLMCYCCSSEGGEEVISSQSHVSCFPSSSLTTTLTLD